MTKTVSVSVLALGAFLGLTTATTATLSIAAPPSKPGPEQNYKRSEKLGKDAQAALESGDTKAAARLAKERLRLNTDTTSWDYGNVVYEANQVLGLAALKEGNLAKAGAYLLAAGKTPGSPQLNSFGPDMTLAQELMKKGQKQTVSAFLTSVRRFWGVAPANASQNTAALYAMHDRMIAQWQREIKAGKQPSLDPKDQGAASGPSTPRVELLAAGTLAPDFTATDKDGKTVKLSDFRGKVVVVDFWASWCPPCVASMPHNQAVAKKLQDAGVPVVILALDNSEERAPFLKWTAAHSDLNLLVFAHADPKTADIVGKSYNVTGIPTQYVIDAQGRIRKSFVGFGGPDDSLENAVRAAQVTRAAALPVSLR